MDLVNPIVQRWRREAADNPDAFWDRAARHNCHGSVPGTGSSNGTSPPSAGSSAARLTWPTTASTPRSSAGTATAPPWSTPPRAASIDEDGYVWFAGRADEIIKIAVHRLGTIEVESAFLKHPAVAEAGVTGRPDELRGEVISAFVVLKQGFEMSDQLRRELLDTVRQALGAVAVIGELTAVSMVPKTRSGKIMRRVLRAVVLDRDPGDIATIEGECSVEDARQAWEELKQAVQAGR